ncbi:2-amino-3-carboxymuconate-6-semialdehyde decarboxylase [Fusarium agapanthi]|uniref:6-methylsalicylate decarboxylase n=1 Tax=Fusarium agapanthi TaxID=1803897 RepID=A0A9P5E8A4_9HYPO|nr:2-amino-3-carboxymuconate-6-semialdehyde decarboxylase [Fusarium agapanthi]
MKFLSLFSVSLAVTACRSTPSPQKSAKIDVHAHFVPDFYAKALKEAGMYLAHMACPILPNGMLSFLKEIDYLFKQLNPKPDGIVMMSNYYGLYLGDRDLEPIYDALNELNVTIFEHLTTPCTQFNKMRFDIDKTAPSISQQQWQALNSPVAVRQFAAPTLDFPFETARTFADLFYTSMPTKFPNLKWIMSHAGGGLIPTLDRIVTYSALYPGLNLTEDSMKQTLSKSFYFDLPDLGLIVWGSDTVFTPMSSAAKYAAAFDKDVEEGFPDRRKANAIRATNARGLFD